VRAIILHCPHLGRDISELQAIPHAEILLGEPTPRGEDGCLEMHKEAVRIAIADGDPQLFVMEDDCQFTQNFSYDKWIVDLVWAAMHGYDVVVGGCTRTSGERQVRDGIIEVSAICSAHCIVYFDTAYEKVLKAVQPFDISLGRDCGLKIALVHPFVAVQRPSYSGILKQEVDYVPLYQQHENRLRHLPVTEAY
jgi:hypothetical protein